MEDHTLTRTPPQDEYFDTSHLKADLKGRSVRGGAVTMAAQGAKFFLQIGSTVVLARLLTPQDFGLIAMVTAVTGFVVMFKDMGLSMATIQRAEINHGQISTLFWINVLLSLGIMLVTAALAPAIAWFYDEQRLTWITLALAGAFIFGGLTIQHQALLKRQMRFVTLALIQIISISAGILAAIIAAWQGMGYWALVIQQLAIAIANLIAVWVACGWRPDLPTRRSGIRGMLAFGSHITGFNVINYFARNSDNILIGRFCGSGTLGLYSKAYNLLLLPISQIRGPLNAVALPALSRIQDDPNRYKSYYTKLLLLISFISMPLTVFMSVCSKSFIPLLLGDQWLGASSIFQVLAIAAFIQPAASTRGLVLVTMGQSGRYLKFGLINGVLIVASFAIGIRWGAIGVALAYTIANFLILIPSLWYCFRLTPISVATFFKAIVRPVIASLTMAMVVQLGHRFVFGQPDIIIISISLIIGLLTYLLTWTLLPGGLQLLHDFCFYISLVFQKQTQTSPTLNTLEIN